MARFLGVGCVFKSPMTTRTYVVSAAPQWTDIDTPLKPPAHIIGVGGFGATYRVVDDRGETFAMKEYFPRDHAARGPDGRITPRRSEDGFSKKIYEEGLRRFVAEGRLLTAFSHPNVLRVVDAFDDSGTSYQLMRLVEGREQLGESDTGGARIERRVTLEDFLRELEANGVPIDLPLIRPVLKQLLDAVEYIHTEGSRKAQEITGTTTRALLHRDIKPSNILIEAPDGLRDAPPEEVLRHADTKAILIDFGSARIFRDVQQDDVSRSIGVVTEGYAPPELKDNDIDSQGPHSDIYSIAAVIWRALTGRKPTTAQLANGAKLAELATPIVGADGKSRPRASQALLQAVDRALSAGVNQRPQSVAQWRAELGGQSPSTVRPKGKTQAKDADGTGRKKGGQALWWWAAVFGLIGVSVYGLIQSQGGPARNIEREAEAAGKDIDQVVRIAQETGVKAEQASRDAGELVAQGSAKAEEARAKYQRFVAMQTVVHGPNDGDAALGEKSASTTNFFGVRTSMWCHKRQASISEDYLSGYQYADVALDGDPHWSCATPHTHHLDVPFNEPKNPWHVEGAGYVFDGEVDDQQRPSGLGEIAFNKDKPFAGRVSVDGTNLVVLGGAKDAVDPVRGRFTMTVGAMDNVSSALASVHLKDGGQWQVEMANSAKAVRMVGLIGDRTDERTGFLYPNGWIGKQHKQDGSDIYVTGDKQAWGRIEQPGGVYVGQITGGKPDGCGVWRWRDQPKEVGFFVAGVKQSGDLPDACKNPHYQRPIDIDAVARSGAAALPL